MASLPVRVERDIADIVATLTHQDGELFERTIRGLIEGLAKGLIKLDSKLIDCEELQNELAGWRKLRFDLARNPAQLRKQGITIPTGQKFPRWRMVFRLNPFGIDILIIGYRKDVYEDAKSRLPF